MTRTLLKIPLIFMISLLVVTQVQGQDVEKVGPSGITNGILSWLDATDVDGDGNTANNPALGDSVDVWSDKSGSGNDATVASGKNAGQYISDQINGKSVIRFNRIDNFNGSVYVANGIDLRAGINPDVTIFTVYMQRDRGTALQEAVWGIDDGAWDRFFFTHRGNDDGAVSLGPVEPTVAPVPGAGKVGEVRLLTAVYDGTVSGSTNLGPANGSAIYFNGKVITRFTDSTHPTDAQAALNIGRDGDDNVFNGDVAEMIIYNRKLTDCEIEDINAYLSSKYGVDFTNVAFNYNLPAPHIHDINGIGKGTSSCNSATTNSASSGILTVSNPSANNTAGSFITFGNDRGGYDASTEAPAGFAKRLVQEWRADVDGSLGTVDVCFDLTDLGISLANTDNFALLLDTDGNFSNATAVFSGKSVVGNKVCFSGVTFSHGQYFTLATELIPAPVAPVFTSTPVTEATENVPYSYAVSATNDNNTNNLTFSGERLPAWLSITQGQSTATQFGETIPNPGASAIDENGNVYVTSESGTAIYKIQPNGTTTSWLTRNTGLVYAMQVYQGYLYISYWDAHKITKVDLSNPEAGETIVLTGVAGPLSIVEKDNYLYVALHQANKVIKLDPTTNLYTDYVSVSDPFGLGFDKNGALFIASINTGNISKYDGSTLSVVLNGLSMPTDIKIDRNDNLYVSFYSNGGIRKYEPDLSSYIQISANTSVWSMSLNPAGSLIFGDINGNKVLKLETGAVLTGTPTHADVGTHEVTLRVSNGSLHTDQSFTITVSDVTAPTISIASTQASPAKGAFPITFTFSEEVTGFELADITSANATVSDLQSTDNIMFTATVTPNEDGEVSLQLLAGAVTDKAGNPNTASKLYVIYADGTRPTVALTSESPEVLNSSYYSVTFTFSEPITGFREEDIRVENGQAYKLYSQDGRIFTVVIVPTADGQVKVNLPADKAADMAANGNEASNELTRMYDISRPAVTITTPAAESVNAAFPVTITFSEAVSGFQEQDITVTNGIASAFEEVSGSEYRVLITPTTDGEVMVSVHADVAQDAATNGNTASTILSRIYDATVPEGYMVSFDAEIVDVTNEHNLSFTVTGAEIGTTYFFSIVSDSGGEPVTGSAQVTEAGFVIADLDLSGLADGQLTLTFYLQDAAGNKGPERLATVSKVTWNIVSVTTPAVIKVPIRTSFAQVPLPATVEVTYSNGTKAYIGVTWAQGNYNGLVVGQYPLTGELTLAPMTTNLDGKIAAIVVEVEPNKVPTAVTFSATTFKPEAKFPDVIGTFSTTDPDDTEFVYTLITGEGDTHNSLFEIRGNQVFLRSNNGLSGLTQFTIRVRSTDSYANSIEQSFTLTKEPYAVTEDLLKIVNAFSPNGDGINDTWIIPELRFYNSVEIEVFDRSGIRLFHTTNPEQGWEGSNRQGQVLQGAFFYVVQIKDIGYVKRGVVTVLKNR